MDHATSAPLSPISSAIDLLYPPTCGLCAVRLHPFEETVCDPCRAEILGFVDWRCPLCGATGAGRRPEPDERCPKCPPPEAAYRGVLSATAYRDPAARCVHLFKYDRRMEMGKLMAGVMVSRLSEPLLALEDRVGWIVPVPLHWSRRLARGFNQSLHLAEALARSLRLPLQRGVLRRIRATKRQTRIPSKKREEREENVRGAFRVHPAFVDRLPGILLVDDVVTLGCTANECARMLVNAGAPQVWVACFARA